MIKKKTSLFPVLFAAFGFSLFFLFAIFLIQFLGKSNSYHLVHKKKLSKIEGTIVPSKKKLFVLEPAPVDLFPAYTPKLNYISAAHDPVLKLIPQGDTVRNQAVSVPSDTGFLSADTSPLVLEQDSISALVVKDLKETTPLPFQGKQSITFPVMSSESYLQKADFFEEQFQFFKAFDALQKGAEIYPEMKEKKEFMEREERLRSLISTMKFLEPAKLFRLPIRGSIYWRQSEDTPWSYLSDAVVSAAGREHYKLRENSLLSIQCGPFEVRCWGPGEIEIQGAKQERTGFARPRYSFLFEVKKMEQFYLKRIGKIDEVKSFAVRYGGREMELKGSLAVLRSIDEGKKKGFRVLVGDLTAEDQGKMDLKRGDRWYQKP